jgi:hypothetical protein
MRLAQNIKRKSVARHAMTLLAAITLTGAVVTNAVAAGRGGSHHGGGFAATHMGGGSRGQFLDSVPPMRPVFNPSSPYTVPQSPETPVSPASPGSVFGNG